MRARRLKKKIFGILFGLLVVAMLALPISAVYATKPIPVAGTFFPTGMASMVTRTPGNSDNLILEFEGSQTWMGSFVGSAVTECNWIVHKESDPEAPGNDLSNRCLFTLDVEYDGKSGTLIIKGAEGHWRIVSGTGDLANLRGQGTISVINAELMIMGYEGQVHFNP